MLSECSCLVFSNLSGRKQRGLSGVPQKYILGHLPFLIYINDIVNQIGGSIHVFAAGDTSLNIIVVLPEQAARILNADLQTISQWANSCLVTFNPSKTLSMIFSRKLNLVQHTSLFMNGNIIEETTSHKHIGLTFSSTCIWKDHVNSISDNAWTRLNLLRVLKFRVSGKSHEKMYISYIRPLLEYSDSVWENCSSD